MSTLGVFNIKVIVALFCGTSIESTGYVMPSLRGEFVARSFRNFQKRKC